MKLYSTVTSERASKGQGGNDFLHISVRDEGKKEIASIKAKPIYVNGEYKIDLSFKIHNKVTSYIIGEARKTKGKK